MYRLFWPRNAETPPRPRAAGGAWVAGTFDVRMIDVGRGDAQLIVFPSGYSILVDVPENSWNSRIGAARVAGEVRRIS
jgi:beta-lactamase superfamily II metal-dependent hydrolase|eukprot:SAG25_NODE_3_length_30426_cov_8.268210_2_plen_78_part_00